jgi:hypothetical protein
VAPANDGTAHVIFTGPTRPTPNVESTWFVASITFDNVSGPFAIGGLAINVFSGVITNNAISYGQIFNTNIVVQAAQTWTAADAMSFNGNVALAIPPGCDALCGWLQRRERILPDMSQHSCTSGWSG